MNPSLAHNRPIASGDRGLSSDFPRVRHSSRRAFRKAAESGVDPNVIAHKQAEERKYQRIRRDIERWNTPTLEKTEAEHPDPAFRRAAQSVLRSRNKYNKTDNVQAPLESSQRVSNSITCKQAKAGPHAAGFKAGGSDPAGAEDFGVISGYQEQPASGLTVVEPGAHKPRPHFDDLDSRHRALCARNGSRSWLFPNSDAVPIPFKLDGSSITTLPSIEPRALPTLSGSIRKGTKPERQEAEAAPLVGSK